MDRRGTDKPKSTRSSHFFIWALVPITLITFWVTFQNAIWVAAALSNGTPNRSAIIALSGDIVALTIVSALFAWLFGRALGVSKVNLRRNLLQTAVAIAYLIVSTIFVPRGEWNWVLPLLFVPITVILALSRASVGWFIGIELFLSIVLLCVVQVVDSRFGLGNLLVSGAVWLVLIGGGVVYVAIQLPIYWLVKFLARKRIP